MKDFFSKDDQMCSFLRIWSHLLQKYLMENFIFCAVTKFEVFSSQLSNTSLTKPLKYRLLSKHFNKFQCMKFVWIFICLDGELKGRRGLTEDPKMDFVKNRATFTRVLLDEQCV